MILKPHWIPHNSFRLSSGCLHSVPSFIIVCHIGVYVDTFIF